MIKIYTIYQYTHHGSVDDLQAIKEGFTFFGFFCPLIWLLFNKLWKLLIIYLGLAIFLSFINYYEVTNDSQNFALLTLSNLFIGIMGNDFFKENLKKRGYEMLTVIAARNQDEALLNFLGSYESI